MGNVALDNRVHASESVAGISTGEKNSAANSSVVMVKTSRFGEVEVDLDRVITLTSPLLGFPESRRFFLRAHGPDSPFMWLQSLDNPNLAFVVVQPLVVNPEYRPAVNMQVRTELEIKDDTEMDLMLILTIPAGRAKEMTANLLGPVVFNVRKRLARQMLLDPTRYDSTWRVLS
ncbi:MAG: flagellar assembly protein FliW [Proteobacteria bacterium]|nr:flagellar assembly protein FliW [Pseudomonadota bacterium]MBU1716466.1 flagellar assembly protein FliW [Pseudomonadota bacterium]